MAKTPLDFANLENWYKANAGVTGTTTVTAWADFSGHSRDLAGESGHEPELLTSVINSLPVISAYGKSARMFTAGNFPDLSSGGTVWFVGRQKVTGAVTSGDEGAWMGAGSPVNMQVRRGDTAGSGWGSVRAGINTSDGNSPETTTHINEDQFYTFRLRYDGTNNYLSVNGGTEVTLAASGGGYIATPLTIFKTLSQPYGNKQFAEIIVYSVNQSSSDRLLVEYYLNQKYGHYTWSGGVPAGWDDTTAVITFPSLPTKTVGDADFAPGATSNSPAAITYSSDTPSVATIVSGNIHIVGAGTSQITASQGSTTGYTAATPVIRTLTVNPLTSSTMAVNQIDGNVVGLWYSTNLSTPAWKEIVCAENTGLDGTTDVSTKKTKCGTIKTVGSPAFTVTGSGVANSAPTSGQGSVDELLDLFQAQTPVKLKIAHATDTSIIYRSTNGQAYLSSYSENYNTGDSVGFDFTFDVSLDWDITP